MTDTAHPLPGTAAVFAEQLRVTGLAVRREALVLTAVLSVLAAMLLFDAWTDGDALNGLPIPPVMMIVMGALAPFAVWKGERVFGGAYLWTLPVGRRRHALIKVFAGGVWLLVAIAAIQLWILGVSLASGGDLMEHRTRMLAGPGGAADLIPVAWTPRPWEWVAPFTTGAICYLIGSAFILGVKYPLRWGTAAVALFPMLGLLSETGITGGLAEALFGAVVNGPLGIDAAMTGRGVADETERLTGGRDVVGPEVLVIWYRLPSLGQWAPATLLWAALGALALAVGAWRHRET